METNLDAVLSRLESLMENADKIREKKKLPPRPSTSFKQVIEHDIRWGKMEGVMKRLIPGDFLANIMKVEAVEERLEREISD